MSQISGSGLPPRVSGASHIRDQQKKEKIYDKSKHDAPEQRDKGKKRSGHDERAVAVSPSVLHGDVGDILAGFISGPGPDGHLILENKQANFSILSVVNLFPGQLVKIEITKMGHEIEGKLLQSDDLILKTPLALKLSTISLHAGAQETPAPSTETAPPLLYTGSYSPTVQEDAASSLAEAGIKLGLNTPSEIDTTVSQPFSGMPEKTLPLAETTPSNPLSGSLSHQDLAQIIAAGENATTSNAPSLEAVESPLFHDRWSSLAALRTQIKDTNPVSANDLAKVAPGDDNGIPDGLALYLGALFFPSTTNWLGEEVRRDLESQRRTSIYDSLRSEFDHLRAALYAEGTDQWTMKTVTHPDSPGKLDLRVLLQMVDAGDGTRAQVAVTRLILKDIGPVQIESMAHDNRLIVALRTTREVEAPSAARITTFVLRLAELAGLNTEISFEPVADSPFDVDSALRLLTRSANSSQ
jgi:hypothetical protein